MEMKFVMIEKVYMGVCLKAKCAQTSLPYIWIKLVTFTLAI